MIQLLYIIASLHAALCPYTKVEESFNIQATHDILYHRHNLSQYDHNEFPGVVPRSFIGPLALSIATAPCVFVMQLMETPKIWAQHFVRIALAMIVIAAWIHLKNTLKKLYGASFAWWYTIITVTQHHFMFYMSRPLPNIMALPLVLLAFEGWLSNKPKQFLVSAGASIIIFRSELAMLFGLFLIMDLYFKKIDVTRLLKIVIPAGLALVGLTVAVDSVFWGRLTWPEAEVFYYNTILNKSSDWGTSPFLWYFYSALPRGLGPSFILIPIGLYLDKKMVQAAAPAFVYILLYSFLPHKELRFIIYVFPLLNMASAAACSFIFVRRAKGLIFALMSWVQLILITCNIGMTTIMVCVAINNYPGGTAITRFHKLLANEPYVHVHISNLAAQTGVTRFTQLNSHWQYSKNESLQAEQLQEFTHLLIEAKSKYSPRIKKFAQTHDVIDSIESFTHIVLSSKITLSLIIKTKPAIFILQRKDFREYPHGRNLQHIDAIETIEMTDDQFDKFEESVRKEYIVEETEETYLNDKLYNYEENETQKSEETIDENEPEVILEEEEIENVEEKIEKGDIDTKDEGGVSNKEIVDEIKVEPTLKQARLKKTKSKVITLSEEEPGETPLKLVRAKKAIDDLNMLRQERKKKAIEKIKSETRREVVASAKKKLKEIMKRHIHIADELSEDIISISKNESNEEIDGRGDIPDIDSITKQENEIDTEMKAQYDEKSFNGVVYMNETLNSTNEFIDSIVEEVIARLIDKRNDDKTKLEDIKTEDRQMIQKIVEEVLSERMNNTKKTL